MAALLAFVMTAVVALVVLVLDAAAQGAITRFLSAPVPFVPRIPSGLATIIAIGLAYAGISTVLNRVVAAGRALAAAGSPPSWVEDALWLDRALRHDDGRWPLALAVVIGVVAALAAPVALLGAFPPAAWSLFALAGVTLSRMYREREGLRTRPLPAGPTPPPPPTPPALPDPMDVVARLRQSRRYRGQLRAVTRVGPRLAGTFPLSGSEPWARDLQPGGLLHAVLVSLHIPGVSGLAAHQLSALERFLPDPSDNGTRHHVVLATGPGSGRRLTLFLATLERTLRRGAHVLVLTPDDSTLERERERFHALADQTDWRYALYEDALADDWDGTVPDPPPEVLFCSLATLHRVLLKEHRAWSEFFASLELVITYDLDRYSGIIGANAAQVFRRLGLVARAHGQALQFVATAHPAGNLRAFAAELLALSPPDHIVHVIDVESGPRPTQVYGLWLPSLDARPSAAPGAHLTRQVTRQSLFDAAVELAAMLVETPDLRVLLYGATFGQQEAQELEQQIFQAVGRQLPKSHLALVPREDDLGEALASYDALIILGAPAEPRDVARLSGRLGAGRNGGLVMVLAPPSPAALSLIRSLQPEASDSPRALAPLIPLHSQHPQVVAKHLACALVEVGLTDQDLVTAFGAVGQRIVEAWRAEGRIGVQDEFNDERLGDKLVRRLALTEAVAADVHGACPLDTVGVAADLVPVRTLDGRVVLQVDRHREACEIYPHRAVFSGQHPLVISLAAGEAQAVPPADQPGLAVPLYRVTARPADGSDAEGLPLFRMGDGEPLGLARRRMTITQTLVATRRLRSAQQRHDAVVAAVEPVRSAEFTTEAVVLTGSRATGPLSPQVAHSLAHLFRTVLGWTLPPALCRTEAQVAVVPELPGMAAGPSILIYDTVHDGMGLAEALADAIPGLHQEAYRILVACPCRAGCAACLHDPECRIFQDSGACAGALEKRETLRLLGRVLDPQVAARIAGCAPAALDRLRYEVVSDANDLLRMRDGVLRYGLLPVLGIGADLDYRPAPVRFMTEAERQTAGLLGFFRRLPSGEREVVVRPEVEEALVGLLGHEFAHDWQHRLGPDGQPTVHPTLYDPALVPYGGRLFLEGFAQWMELRVLDGYGFKESFDDIVFRMFDEYGEGYHIIKMIEDRAGIAGVLRRMHDAISPEEVARLIAEAGTESRIRELMRRIEDRATALPPADTIIAGPDPAPGTPPPPRDDA
ncbi:MAG: DUF1998 domain-containing protein [Chloroflexi bacterium]|nr:DUF1998 domain-containing protein [Chloroflexota bacterium]